MSARALAREGREQFSNDAKLALAALDCKMKEEYNAEVKRNEGKTKYDAKRKRISTVRNNPNVIQTKAVLGIAFQ